MKETLLITGPMYPPTLEELERTYDAHRLWTATDREAMLASLADKVTAVASSNPRGIDAATIAKLPKLKVISHFGVGYETVDVAAAGKQGVKVTNTPDVLTEEVADLAIALVLATLRRVPQGDKYVRDGKWLKGAMPLADSLQGKTLGIVGAGRIGQAIALVLATLRRVPQGDKYVRDGKWLKGAMSLADSLQGKTLGIVGAGRIGQAIAKRALAFNMPVIYQGPNRKAALPYKYFADPVELAKEADVIMVACPGGDATKNLVNAAVLEALGPKGYVVNIARGSIIDEQALLAALQQNKIAGAGLDVFVDEPRVPEAFFALDNVVLQPHVGSATHTTRKAMGQLVIDNLAAHFAGKPLVTPV